MPLDGHSYLVAQGWTGKGTGLREGAISRPLAIPQKRTLAGVGKDRDEAFPFWDHLFSAAAKSIQLKIYNSDEESDGEDEAHSTPALSRTSTGILSNRRPGVVLSTETSGTTTPVESRPRYNLLATAKREAAKQNLYSRFFRGPVLGPDMNVDQGKLNCSVNGSLEHVSADSGSHPDAGIEGQKVTIRVREAEKSEDKKKRREGGEERARRKDEKSKSRNGMKKTKRKDKTMTQDTSEIIDGQSDSDEERQRRKREKKLGRAAGREGDGKQRKKRGKIGIGSTSEDASETEEPIRHRKKRRRKE